MAFTNQGFSIVTLDSPSKEVLSKKTEAIQDAELPLAKEIAEKLYAALKPFFPAAGLAAPQIGISKSLFIYSFDRDPQNLEVVINPDYEAIDEAKIVGWEGCFSAQCADGSCKVAKIPRYEKIRAFYTNIEGKRVEKVLKGFAAKVFQHEYDHLQGIICIGREGAIVKEFQSPQEMASFFEKIKKDDSLQYQKPLEITKIKAILFDCDGKLIDNNSNSKKSFN